MGHVSVRYAHLDHAVVPVGVTTLLLSAGRARELSLQYQMHQAVGSVEIDLYGTNEQTTARLVDPDTGEVLDPDTLPAIWDALASQFATSPIIAVGTELLEVDETQPCGFVAVRLDVSVELAEFSLISNSKT